MRCAVNTLDVPSPVLVLGASGFIGSHIYRKFQALGVQVLGTSSASCNLERPGSARALLLKERPRLVLNCVGYGGYPDENDGEKIFRLNVGVTREVLETLRTELPDTLYVHAGSSSEYGSVSAGPDESVHGKPDSLYAIAKQAASELIQFYGKEKRVRAINLRLYSVYGPGEPETRLIPRLIQALEAKTLPPFASAETSRDFVHVEDVAGAFLAAALSKEEFQRGNAYNIASGVKTTLRDLAELARVTFQITESPRFETYPARAWDRKDWYGNPKRSEKELGWKARIDLKTGLALTLQAPEPTPIQFTGEKLAVIVACFRDAQALPELHSRLRSTLTGLSLHHRLIFINDGSPDDTEEVLRRLSEADGDVLGISHSRNFGSQAAFRSGLDLLAEDEACVWMDGDLQDPPEAIANFVEKWREGFDIVYGVRVTRDESWLIQGARKLFYRLFRWAADTPIPLDAGDFGLLSPRAAKALRTCQERDLFWRGLRAFVGFRQTGVPYHRPARKHGRSTNSWLANLEWAKRGIFSFSGKFLRGYFLMALVMMAGLATAFLAIKAPRWTPWLVISFGLFQVLGLALVTDYLGRIFQEVKRRPPYIRVSRIETGHIEAWND